MRSRIARTMIFVPATMFLVVIACSQRVTPEEEYAERERNRPLLTTSTEGAPPGGIQASGAPSAGAAAEPVTDPDAIAVTVTWPAPPDQAVASTDVLFVFVRPPDVTTGPPLAVRGVPAPSFPLSIQIGPRDAMIPGTEFPERVAVSARLDRDGNAMTSGPDDWMATSPPVAAGGAAEIVLEPGGSR